MRKSLGLCNSAIDGGVNLGPETKDEMTTIIISESNLCRVVRPEAATENTIIKLKV